MFDSLKITTSYLSFYCFKVLFLNLKRNFRESYVFHCLVIKVLNSPSLGQLIYFTTFFTMCQVLFSSFSNLSGEGGIWTLAPLLTTYSLSRGAPSASLGTSPNCPTQSLLIFFRSVLYYIALFFVCQELFWIIFILNSGESGIRTHAPLRTNGFQDRLVMTTSISLHMHFSVFDVSLPDARCILSSNLFTVNTKFYIFSIFFQKHLCNVQILRCCDL